MRSLALPPDDSLTISKMALSIGFVRFVSSTNLALAGLPPTEYASLSWTHTENPTLQAVRGITSGLPVIQPRAKE
jgi:hypothetical protein